MVLDGLEGQGLATVTPDFSKGWESVAQVEGFRRAWGLLERWRDPGVGSIRELMGMLLQILNWFYLALSPAVGKDNISYSTPMDMPVTPRFLGRPASYPSTTGHTNYFYTVTFVQGLSRRVVDFFFFVIEETTSFRALKAVPSRCQLLRTMK